MKRVKVAGGSGGGRRREPFLLACRWFDRECAGYLAEQDLEDLLLMTCPTLTRRQTQSLLDPLLRRKQLSYMEHAGLFATPPGGSLPLAGPVGGGEAAQRFPEPPSSTAALQGGEAGAGRQSAVEAALHRRINELLRDKADLEKKHAELEKAGKAWKDEAASAASRMSAILSRIRADVSEAEKEASQLNIAG
eukprot:jgi/Botrbrau1/18640/Bobra.0367s0076.1